MKISGFGDPNFHFGTNISNDKRTLSDFQFAIALNKWLKDNYNILKNNWQNLN
ncbi:hypothetical protein M0Q97_09210 [Candidatus Dojkabacteria bacterium]|jgi:hypothetical protein|nr:hypothetical protein [Candidatus Dojkabacteria bacterium]